jgi:hypothetical protein
MSRQDSQGRPAVKQSAGSGLPGGKELGSSAVEKGFCDLLNSRTIPVVAVLCLLCAAVVAQAELRPSPFARIRAAQAASPPPPLQRPPQVRSAPGPHRGDWLRRYGNLPSDQAERHLQQDKDFQRLPPERQQTLQRRLQHFTNLPPQQKQQMLNRMELIEHMPPEQQKRVESLWQQFRGLGVGRRRAVIDQLRYLRKLPAEQRNNALDAPQFKSGFNPQEQQLIRGLNDIDLQLQGMRAGRGPGF